MAARGADPAAVRVAELMAAVSAASDFAKGLPEEQALRTCRLAMTIAERAGLGADDQRSVFYLSLLRFVGCTATAPEMAAALGDEIAVSAAFAAVNPRDLRAVVPAAVGLVGPLPRHTAQLVRFLRSAPTVVRDHEVASCEVARMFAERMGLPAGTAMALGMVFERWDGHGNPGLAGGADIPLPVRVEQVAHGTEVLVRTAGPAGAVDALRRCAGSVYDPGLVDLVCTGLSGLPADPDDGLDQAAVLAMEPTPWLELTGAQLDAALPAIGAIADLKSAYTRGHAAGVASHATAAGRHAGLPDGDVVLLARAGWLHDLGRVAVSARVWDKPGELTAAQWEQVRLHPYITERVLGRCGALTAVAALAGAHHERADGSGYHRGTGRLTGPAALLAAADVYQALGEDRAYRPGLDPARRRAALLDEAATGGLTGWAVEAVLAGAGERVPMPGRDRPGEPLTAREQQVLAQVARGATNRAVAQALGISAKTVNAHLEHIFAKLGVTTRGAAAFHAVESGLLDP